MLFIEKIKKDWLSNVNKDIIAGILVAFALIPESLGFAIIAGVDPKVALYASCCIALIISIAGGRPAMISAATGAMALVIVSLVKNYGVEYLLAATILAGFIQMLAGYLKVSSLLHYVSHSVILGFINSLAILIFLAQISELISSNYLTYIVVVCGLLIIYLFPYITKKIPSPLICIIALTIVCYFLNLDVTIVKDLGNIPTTLPSFLIPNIPFTMETLKIILPYSLTLAAVGLLESLLTAVIVDDMTETPSNKNTEAKGQGLANIVTGFFGGMAGCAMIGQSVINVKSGARGRLSTFVTGIFLLLLILLGTSFVNVIPMGALIAIMIFISISTFSWQSISFNTLKTQPKTATFIMFVTIITVISTHNLALGVLIGVILKALFFARNVSRALYIEEEFLTQSKHKIYKVHGQIFFIVAEKFIYLFNYNEDLKEVTIDLSDSNLWDLSAVAVLNKVKDKFIKRNILVNIKGLNKASRKLIDSNSNV